MYWEEFTRRFKLEDSFATKAETLRFSWDNKQSFFNIPDSNATANADGRILNRIDRICRPKASMRHQLRATSYIIPSFNLSDHALVTAIITTRQRSDCPSYYKMNSSHLIDPILQEKIEHMWTRERSWNERVNSDPLTLMLNCIK